MIVHAELELTRVSTRSPKSGTLSLPKSRKLYSALADHHCGANINSAPPPMFQPLRVTLTDMSDTE